MSTAVSSGRQQGPDGTAAPATTGWRTALRRELAVDPSGWQPLGALRAALGVAIPLFAGLAAGDLTSGVIAAAGALPAGVAGYVGLRGRWSLVLLTTVGMTGSTFVGSLVAGHEIGRIVAVTLFGFLAGLAVTLGRSASLVGTQAVIGLVVFGRFPSSVAAAAAHAGLVAAGGLLQALLIGIRPPRRFGRERRAIATALDELAAVADGVPRGAPTGRAAAALAEAQELLARRLDTSDLSSLRGLLDDASRVRLELSSLTTVRGTDGVDEVSRAAAEWLRRLAAAVASDAEPPQEVPTLAAAVERLWQRREQVRGAEGVGVRYAAARAQALLGQLRALQRQAAALSGLRRIALPTAVVAPAPAVIQLGSQVAGMGRRLRLAATDVRSSAFRHGVRLAATLVITGVIADRVPWQRGYWVTLTAVVVLKPDYAATLQRGLARVAGTVIGAGLAGLLIDGLHPSEFAEVIVIAVLAWICYAVFAASYAVYSVAVSGLVVVLLSPTGVGSLTTAGDRAISTVLGGATAILASAMWPLWERDTLPGAIGALLAALAGYADLVLGGYGAEAPPDRRALNAAADTARRFRAEAQASMERAAAEPARIAADISTAAGVMAATQRIVVALHALRTTLEDTSEPLALDEVEPMRAAVGNALRALSEPGTAFVVGGLREEQQRLARAAEEALTVGPPLSDLRARRLALLATQLDPLVDSVDTVAHLARGDVVADTEAAS